jgi:hypothetical protein
MDERMEQVRKEKAQKESKGTSHQNLYKASISTESRAEEPKMIVVAESELSMKQVEKMNKAKETDQNSMDAVRKTYAKAERTQIQHELNKDDLSEFEQEQLVQRQMAFLDEYGPAKKPITDKWMADQKDL